MKKSIAVSVVVAASILGVARAGFAGPDCPVSYAHPGKAAKIDGALVQAFVSCGNPGGSIPNATTETGSVPTCYPAETFNDRVGTPNKGWLWGPHAKGSVRLKAGKNKLMGPPDYPQNTDPSAADLFVEIKLQDVRDQDGPVTSSTVPNVPGAHVDMMLRFTLIDRDTTQLVTLMDVPFRFKIRADGGKVLAKTSLAALLDETAARALPACTNVELVSFWVEDPAGSRFAAIGTFLP